jgi:N-acetylmuramoyl-L-alanine amidase
MAKIHNVQQGETVSSIARKYGFPDWQALYNHPDNSALKEKRPNPDLIYPKDEIAIPERNLAKFKAKLNEKQTFKSKAKRNVIKLKIGAIGGVLWANRKVELKVDEDIIESTTDDDGIAVFRLPKRHSHTAILNIYTLKETSKPSYSVEVKLGHLDPITELTGQQARLSALGFDCGLLTPKTNKRYEKALVEYQQAMGLIVDGICGPETQKSLEKEYGC